MSIPVSDAEARSALRSIDDRRRQVVDEIDVPRWYWPALAGGWVVLGVVADVASPWVSVGATLAFGAAHAAFSPRVPTGRHASSRVSVRGDLVGRRVPALVVGLLVVMVAATVAVAGLLRADGARHPATWAGVVVAALLLVEGPALRGTVRRRVGPSHAR